MTIVEELLKTHEFCKQWSGSIGIDKGSAADMCLVAADEIKRLTAENRRLSEIVCNEYKINVDNPLFQGLVCGSMNQGMMLATIRSVVAERDEAREAAKFMLSNPSIKIYRQLVDRWPWLEEETKQEEG